MASPTVHHDPVSIPSLAAANVHRLAATSAVAGVSGVASFVAAVRFAEPGLEAHWGRAGVGAFAAVLAIFGALAWTAGRRRDRLERARVVALEARVRADRDALVRSDEKLRALAAQASVALFETDADGKCTFVNRRWSELTGLSLETAQSRGWFSSVHPDDRQRVADAWAAARQGAEFALDFRFVGPSGTAWVVGRETPLRDGAGTIVGYLGTLTDITDRKTVLDALARSEASFRTVVERAPVDVIVHRDGQIVYLNARALRTLGYAASIDLVGRKVLDAIIHPDHRAAVAVRMRASYEGSPLRDFPVRCLRRDGSEALLEGTGILIEFDGAPSVVFVARDVTARERNERARESAEAAVRASLAEKEVLLQEIHHRVKNNLQVISSLLRLQSARITDPVARDVFLESQNRVHSIALLHESLYQSSDLARIDMAEYVNRLVTGLTRMYADVGRRVQVRTDVRGLTLSLDKAVPCGLIINELLTNAFKHAFPPSGPEKGSVVVSMRENGVVSLVVSDDGVGLPEIAAQSTSKTLGMFLVQTLSKQLRGRAVFERANGTRCTVTFQSVDEGGAS